MEIEIKLTPTPIAVTAPPPPAGGGGAWVEFRGLVRAEENGQPVAALEYEAYSPMAEREMRRILGETALRWPCLAARVIHRVGVVPVGEAAIYVGIAAAHRAEALALLGEFLDQLKQDVPIWKRRAVAGLERAGAGLPEAPLSRGPAVAATPGVFGAADVLALLAELCRPLETERVPLAAAAGRVLRESVCAPEDQPAFARSAVDGYALRLDDASTAFRIVDEIRAGDWKPRTLQPGEAVGIATGAALPGEGLQVVMKEDASAAGGLVTLHCRDQERNIRSRGEDARAGQELVATGTVLAPGALGLLASVGCAQPLVTRLPRVRHLATDNEIVPPEQTPGPGQIRDSNSTLVRVFLGRFGIAPGQQRIGEDEGRARAELEDPAGGYAGADLWLVSGGASVGEHDFTKRLLAQLGFTILVHKTTARPGKPLIVAQRGRTLALGLPGNPLAHFVCLNLYVRAALEAWGGQGRGGPFEMGVLAADLTVGGQGRETFWPAQWRWAGGAVALTPLRWRNSGDLTALAAANALIRVAAGAGRLASGSLVEFAVC
jgi:molybdopterin molybdotransferase